MSDDSLTTWMASSACKDLDPDLFFGDDTQRREGMKVCNGDPLHLIASCPVRDICLEHALTSGEKFGIWGGESERSRKRILKQRRAERRAS